MAPAGLTLMLPLFSPQEVAVGVAKAVIPEEAATETTVAEEQPPEVTVTE